MTYRSIMVHLDREPGAARRVALASDLSIRFGAVLHGVAACEPRTVPSGASDLADEAASQAAEDEARDSIVALERMFHERAGPRADVRLQAGCRPPLPFLTAQGRKADLVVIGRRGPEDVFDGRFGVDPSAVVIPLGRPLLLVPPKVSVLAPQRVMVAWKDTRESRRAVMDALPFLKAAQQVLIVTVGEEGLGDQGGGDVVDHLRAHGIDAPHLKLPKWDVPEGQALIDCARSEQADLIVAGAYGYGRFREWLFGGVTRRLMAGTPSCCLLSH